MEQSNPTLHSTANPTAPRCALHSFHLIERSTPSPVKFNRGNGQISPDFAYLSYSLLPDEPRVCSTLIDHRELYQLREFDCVFPVIYSSTEQKNGGSATLYVENFIGNVVQLRDV